MKIAYYIAALSLTLFLSCKTRQFSEAKNVAISAQHFPTPCELSEKANLIRSRLQFRVGIQNFLKRLSAECQLQRSFEALKTRSQRLGVDIDAIQIYKALRYVERYRYNEARDKAIPVSRIYQFCRRDYKKPLEQWSTDAWDNWSAGISQLPETVKFLRDRPLTLNDMLNAHKGFYTLSDEQGDFSHAPDPGKIKWAYPMNIDRPWWRFSTTEEEQAALKTSKEIYDEYSAYDMLPHSNLKFQNTPLNGTITVIKGVGIFSADATLLPEHYAIWVNTFNRYTSLIRNFYEGITFNDPLWTPMEFASNMQRHFVQVHAFAEGNGRNSRFWQDVILNMFGLPYAASGDMMSDDVLATHNVYYAEFYKVTNAAMSDISRCLNEYEKILGDKPVGEATSLSYDCRILPVKTEHPVRDLEPPPRCQ